MTIMDAIAKAVEQDPDGSSVLINEFVYSVLAEEAEQLRPEIENLLGAFMADRVSIAKRALGRSYVETIAKGDYPEEAVQQHAQWISGIESYIAQSVRKDSVDDIQREYNGRRVNIKVNRNSLGRFSRGVNTTKQTNPMGKLNQKHISPVVDQFLTTNGEGKKEYNPQVANNKDLIGQVERHQHQWDAARKHVQDILGNFNSNEKENLNIVLNLHDDTGERAYQKIVPARNIQSNGNLPENASWELGENLTSVEVDANAKANEALSTKVAAYNTLGSTNSLALEQLSTVDPEKLSALANSFNRRDTNQSRLGTFFDRLKHGGNVMNEIDPLKQYGKLAQFVGAYGPQAEKVLGPHVQQAAYRYRGTEKEPDSVLMQQFNSPEMRAVDVAAQEQFKGARMAQAIQNASLDRSNQDLVVLQAANHELNHLSRTRGGSYTPDELLLNVRADVAARHMLNTLPDDPFVAEVSRKSGNVLPSQGVIIDADGDVVSQAVGFSDDHYLPFDFKNMRSLRGGQYVRTRQQGGLTAEDIYASIRTGTRMATVVSSSGVYSLEFDPNFRGARANSDKARSMYDRYINILDAVDKSGLYVQDIAPAEKEKISSRARFISSNTGRDQKDVYADMLDEARRNDQEITPDTVSAIEEEAKVRVASEGKKYSADRYARRVDEVFNEMINEERSTRANALKLNAKGYEVALKTLQQQFPYFIRNVSYQPLTSKVEGEGFLQNIKQPGAAGARQRLGAEDKGYVSPGGLRSRSVRSGFYETAPSTMAPKNRNATTAVVEEEKPKEDKKATNAAGSVGATKPSTKTTGEQPALKGGLINVINQASKGKVAALKPEINSFVNSFSSMSDETLSSTVIEANQNTSWDEVKDDDEQGTRYLVNYLNSPQWSKIMDSDPDRFAALLSNKKLVDKQVSNLYGASLTLAPFNSIDELKASINEIGKKVGAAASAREPFVPPVQGEEGLYWMGEKPQLFEEIHQMTKPEDVISYFDPNSGNPVAPIATAIATNKDGDYIIDDLPAMNNAARERIEFLGALRDAIQPMWTDLAESGKVDNASLETLASEAGITPEQARKALGNMPDKNEVGMFIITQDAIDQVASNTQKAWAAVTAASYLKDVGNTGDATPKAEPPAGELAKSQPVYSSRQVRFVSKSSPLAKEVQRLRSLNLPLT